MFVPERTSEGPFCAFLTGNAKLFITKFLPPFIVGLFNLVDHRVYSIVDD
jgi:hypothetical protein